MKLKNLISIEDYLGTDYSDMIIDKLGLEFITDPTSLNILYLERSGEKWTSAMPLALSNQEPAGTDVKKQLANILNTKYKDKWLKLYEALTAEYDVLNDYYFKEDRNLNNSLKGNHSDTNSGNSLSTDGVESSDESHQSGSATKVSSQTHTGKSNGKETNLNEQAVYAYDSADANPAKKANAEGSSESSDESEDTGNINDNSKQDITGKAKSERTITANDSRTISGDNAQTVDETEGITRIGRNGIPADLIEAEIRLRIKNIYDIMFRDMDSVLTLRIYGGEL